MSDNNEKTVDLTNVTVPTVLSFCEDLGCEVTELKSYYKVTAPEYNKKSLYVGKAVRRMTRLDVSGFVPEDHPAIVHLSEQDAKELKLGAVRAQILPKDLRDETIDVLEAVTVCVRGLLQDTVGFKLGTRNASDEESGDEHASDCEEFNEEEASIEAGETEEVEIPGAVDFLEVAVA